MIRTPSVRLPAALAAAALLGVPVGAAHAQEPTDPATTVSIDLIEPGEEFLDVLVTLPAGTQVADDGVQAFLDDEPATAQVDQDVSAIARTAVLTMDTSLSMEEDDRLEGAEEAALRFLDTVPADVSVGLVTFDAEPVTVLEPTLDHDAVRAAVQDLETAEDTALYAAVQDAVALLGAEGQRQVLLVSDGEDSVGGDLPATVAQLEETGVRLDAVALDDDSDLASLTTLAEASGGSVLQADAESIAGVLEGEAQTLASQVALQVTVPPGVDGSTAQLRVEVTDAGGATTTASAVAPLGDLAVAAAPAGDGPPPAPSSAGFVLPAWTFWAGVGTFAVGLLAALVLALGRRRPEPTAADRVTSYTEAVSAQSLRKAPADEARRRDPDVALEQAKDAARQVLSRNKGLEARISARLEGAGSALKPAEWLLAHVGIFVAFGVVGALVSGGSIVVGLIFLALGAVLPWVWLGVKRSRRQKAFNSALPDTLQLMSSALSAGLSLAQACDTITREGQEPIASEFKRVLVETRLGVGLEDALSDLAERYDSKDFRWVVMAIRIQREVGGNLGELLDTVGFTMREREYLRRQVDTLAAEGKLSAYVIGGLPPAFFLYLLVANPTYVRPLYTTVLGLLLLVVGLVVLSGGAFWMKKIVSVKV
ncbi:type II secretion system F family protein [Nocardioides zeae]|uniref:Type II secretion system F family protein n=1 Tax=Nocardioides imazamoxiresistens TaxID=3231893 RepID=A0ABU3PXB1_9ACTN|nr:type II secretion system F family protein [Nocardioides zeae]MDT9593789.1 type II secretion system F family protein [Nocardioides zeae]